jgi:hypothetical protein
MKRIVCYGYQCHSFNLWLEHSIRKSFEYYRQDELLLQKFYKYVTSGYGKLTL